MGRESTSENGIDLRVEDLGRMEYAETLSLQRRRQQEVIAGRAAGGGPMHLLLVEHVPPVITLSRRKDARANLLASDEQLRRHGVVVAETDRGGDITYHGPGQIVAYPIVDLNALGLRVHSYMRFLEQIVIDTLRSFAIEGSRDPEATGVWVGPTPAAARKICAMGVRVSRWVSMHGLALNVTTNLDHFDLIVPCGLAGRAVTSMERELGDDCPSAADVQGALVAQFRAAVAGRRAPAPPTPGSA